MKITITEIRDELFNNQIVNRKVKIEEKWNNEIYHYLKAVLEEYKFKRIPENLWCDEKGHLSLLKGNYKIKVMDFLNQEQIEILNLKIKYYGKGE